MSGAKGYVVGFLFNRQGSGVVLIEKRKPDWQAGLLNGVGGKIEAGEIPVTAMAREFAEETGADVPPHLWQPVCVIRHDSGTWVVHYFAAFDAAGYCLAETAEAEAVVKADPGALPGNVHHNLRWLIPSALDVDIAKPVEVVDCCRVDGDTHPIAGLHPAAAAMGAF